MVPPATVRASWMCWCRLACRSRVRSVVFPLQRPGPERCSRYSAEWALACRPPLAYHCCACRCRRCTGLCTEGSGTARYHVLMSVGTYVGQPTQCTIGADVHAHGHACGHTHDSSSRIDKRTDQSSLSCRSSSRMVERPPRPLPPERALADRTAHSHGTAALRIGQPTLTALRMVDSMLVARALERTEAGTAARVRARTSWEMVRV